MGQILALNPRGSGKNKSSKKGGNMGKKNTQKGKGKKNPRASKAAKAAYKKAKSAFEKVNLSASLKKQPAMVGGMYAAKFGANKMSDSGGDREDWDIKAYIGAVLGSYVGAVLGEQVKSGTGQKILDGGLAYTAFKAVRNELIGRSDWATKHFGQTEALHPAYEDEPGDVLLGDDGGSYVLTEGGWRSSDESDRMMGQAVVPVDPVLGQAVVPADPVLGSDGSGIFNQGKKSSIWH